MFPMINLYYSGTTFAESMADWLPYTLQKLGLAHLLNEGDFADFGCGLGTIIAAFQKKHPLIQYIGIDGNQECLVSIYLPEAINNNACTA